MADHLAKKFTFLAKQWHLQLSEEVLVNLISEWHEIENALDLIKSIKIDMTISDFSNTLLLLKNTHLVDDVAEQPICKQQVLKTNLNQVDGVVQFHHEI